MKPLDSFNVELNVMIIKTILMIIVIIIKTIHQMAMTTTIIVEPCLYDNAKSSNCKIQLL